MNGTTVTVQDDDSPMDADVVLRLATCRAVESLAEQTLDRGASTAATRELVEGVHAYLDVVANQLLSVLRDPLACREGCSWCCHQRVEATVPEVEAIARHVATSWTADKLDALMGRIDASLAALEGLDAGAQQASRLPCPLLVDGGCSVYDMRPLICRYYNSKNVEICIKHYNEPRSTDLVLPGYWPLFGAGAGAVQGLVLALRRHDIPGFCDLLGGLKAALDGHFDEAGRARSPGVALGD